MSDSNQKLILRALTLFLFLALLSTAYYFFVYVQRSDLLAPPIWQMPNGLGDGKRSDLDSSSLRGGAPTKQSSEESQTPRHSEPGEESFPKYTGAPIGIINEDKTVSGIYPEATKTKLKNELLEIAKSVSKIDSRHSELGEESPSPGHSSGNLDDWLRAGVIKKFFGDYLGARDLWEYASLIRPQNSTSFANLGGLYAFYLKDFAKAELNYKKAIENSPGDIYLYTSLADLYQSMESSLRGNTESSLRGGAPTKQSQEADIIKTIQSGLVSNPDNQTLLSYLARFYKEQGNTAKALEYYEKVLKLNPNNQAIKSEIEAFK